MATTTPIRRLRRSRVLGSRSLVLTAIGLLAGLAAIGWVAGTAASPPGPDPSGPVEVTQTLLRPGTIAFRLRNDDAQAVTIAQIAVNEAFWPFTATPRTTIAPHGTALVTLRYPWDAGVAYATRFITSTGAMFDTCIAAATTADASSPN
jgi:hypothetical protein